MLVNQAKVISAGWLTFGRFEPAPAALLLAAAASFASAGCGSQTPVAEPQSQSEVTNSDVTNPDVTNSAPKALLPVGAAAPDLAGQDAEQRSVRLSERQGHPAIVYFYPKDGTPGCTKEACAFRDTFDRFNQRGVTIFGVSRDDDASHARFRAEHTLPFPLVADPDGTVQKSYGVPDRAPGMASRVTFLIAADGRIARVWPDVDPAVHADDVLKAIEQLK